ncbi:MAG TPA: GNAT family N-acetyltransferase [Humisphaera sp.]|nr:GNAT family N-acetyltransferase [Humisphaera sp.]
MLELVEYKDPHRFRGAVMDWLLQSEAENCVQIGLIQRMVDQGYAPVSADEMNRPILVSIHDGPRVELVAVQTLRARLIVTRCMPEAAHLLGEWLAAQNWTGGGIVGVRPSAQMIAERYSLLSGRPRKLAIQLRVYALQTITWPRPVCGVMRLCIPADRNLLAEFLAGFQADTGQTSAEDDLLRADRLIEARRIFFWEDPEPVAMAAWAGGTPNGVRINFVYTPPEFRGRGYASNLVAALSQSQLAAGKKLCFLFTDLANPTSNSIYQQIGYTPVSDSERWDFD